MSHWRCVGLDSHVPHWRNRAAPQQAVVRIGNAVGVASAGHRPSAPLAGQYPAIRHHARAPAPCARTQIFLKDARARGAAPQHGLRNRRGRDGYAAGSSCRRGRHRHPMNATRQKPFRALKSFSNPDRNTIFITKSGGSAFAAIAECVARRRPAAGGHRIRRRTLQGVRAMFRRARYARRSALKSNAGSHPSGRSGPGGWRPGLLTRNLQRQRPK